MGQPDLPRQTNHCLSTARPCFILKSNPFVCLVCQAAILRMGCELSTLEVDRLRSYQLKRESHPNEWVLDHRLRFTTQQSALTTKT